MLAEADLNEYLDGIRKEVCTRCLERPPGGPPCAPLGKPCGVEMRLRQLVDAIREVHSELIDPYLDNNRRKVCPDCAFLGSDRCPCPMDYLVILVVQAVEAVDERRMRREKTAVASTDGQAEGGPLGHGGADLPADVVEVAEAALAIAAANAGEWREAAQHARRAWALELATDRPLRHCPPMCQHLCAVIQTAALARASLFQAARSDNE